MALLSRDDINSALRDLPGWRLAHNAVVKEFTFAGFPDAVAFVNSAGAGFGSGGPSSRPYRQL